MTVLAPDRDQRPGGRWSSPSLLGDLLRLAAIERATAHVVAGWAPKVAGLDDKLRLAGELEGCLTRATAVRNHVLALLERDAEGLTARVAWVEPLRRLDVAAHGASSVLDAATNGALPFLLARYEELDAVLDPLYDARLAATVRAAIESLADACDRDEPADHPLRRELEAAWSAGQEDRGDGADQRVALDEVLWAPADRVPFPARPEGRRRPLPGARAHLRSSSRLTGEDIAGELNDNVMAELCALELLARCSYEHPDESWSFHLALARHVSDEQRHAAIFRRLLVQRGYDESTLPQHGANYEWAYEFPECEVGGKRELVWRILVMCTVLEALAVDKLPVEIATRDWLDQPDIARALDYIATDELFHTENGLRLTRD
ncbi:MAG TPA: ferritin-like domain-containing protein, partial [Acidimicrobiales bacterium]|nr:ferritin-like domain-containing protein [Acidimicrobiales bacterium]